jgi:hypothetical protein
VSAVPIVNNTVLALKLLELMAVLPTLIVVMISRLYAHIQTHETVYQPYLNKAVRIHFINDDAIKSYTNYFLKTPM